VRTGIFCNKCTIFKKKTPVYLHEIKRMQTVFFSKKGGFT